MLKSELIERIAEQNPHLYQRDTETIVNAILDTITTALVRSDQVELRGFGMFAAKKRHARSGSNLRDGEPVAVFQKVVPRFKTGRDMHRRLNPSESLWLLVRGYAFSDCALPNPPAALWQQ